MSFEIAKAGWLFRLSSILRRWKKNWVVLYQDGNLKYFDSPDCHVAEECIIMSRECVRIETGSAVADTTPPEGCTSDFLLALQLRDKQVIFSAESPDDRSAWHVALEQSRAMRRQQCSSHAGLMAQNGNGRPPPYNSVTIPGNMYYGTDPPTYVGGAGCSCGSSGRARPPVPHGAQLNHVVQNPDGTQTNVVYVRDQGCRHCHSDGSDMAMGMVAGAALGTMMWGPLLWW